MSELQTPIEGFTHCMCCPPRTQFADMAAYLHPGFGQYDVTRDDDSVESSIRDDEVQFHHIEQMAAANPDHDWRVTIHAPLYTATYQRHGEKSWALIEKGDGFA